MTQPLSVSPGSQIRLADFDARYIEGNWTKQSAREAIRENTAISRDLAYRLYAENRRAVLLILQGMDTAGKDGTIRTVMTGINPQSCQIVPFKQPSDLELDHDFLWRIHHAVPRRGNIGIFNRSHYEDVLVARVHELADRAEIERRYDAINQWEQALVDDGCVIIKCMLHLSEAEQRERLLARLEDPKKQWKFKPNDVDERQLWSQYQSAYEIALERCNTQAVPWHVVPSDRKWYRNWAIARLVLEALESLDLQWPAPDYDVAVQKQRLLGQA